MTLIITILQSHIIIPIPVNICGNKLLLTGNNLNTNNWSFLNSHMIDIAESCTECMCTPTHMTRLLNVCGPPLLHQLFRYRHRVPPTHPRPPGIVADFTVLERPTHAVYAHVVCRHVEWENSLWKRMVAARSVACLWCACVCVCVCVWCECIGVVCVCVVCVIDVCMYLFVVREMC